jgi:hypothetical protein
MCNGSVTVVTALQQDMLIVANLQPSNTVNMYASVTSSTLCLLGSSL